MSIAERELTLIKVIDAPRAKVYAAYSTPELLKQWWAPKPFETPVVDMDFRTGGRFNFVMVGPDGTEYPNEGILLEVIPNEKLVFTDAFTEGWIPKPNPFMVATVTLEDEGEKTKITAVARHWDVETKEKHEQMGFHTGWSTAMDQMEALVKGS